MSHHSIQNLSLHPVSPCQQCSCSPCRCGSHRYPTPCAGAYAVPPGSTVMNTGGQEPDDDPCANYPQLLRVRESFTVQQSGTFRSYCVARWAQAGMTLWFPSLGWLKVTSISGDTIHYKNISIPTGTEIVSQVAFLPMPPLDAAILGEALCGDDCLCDDGTAGANARYLVCEDKKLKTVKPTGGGAP